jgi:hypothetical protein
VTTKLTERDRLQRLQLALEAAVEQLTYAQQIATVGSEIADPPPEVLEIERLLAELTTLRNGIRELLMKELARPTLTILR